MDPIPPQERTWMMSRGVPDSGIRVGSAPGEDGSTIDDQVPCADEAATDGSQDSEDEERFMNGSPHRTHALALLGGAGNTRQAITSQRKSTRQCEGWPVTQPIMHILIGEPPQRPQKRKEEQGRFAVGTRSSSWTAG